MPTTKITIDVSRSTLYGKSTKEPTIKKVSEKADNDSNYYQAAVEALYEDIDLHRLIGFTYFTSAIIINMATQYSTVAEKSAAVS